MPLIDVPTVHAVTDDETLGFAGFTGVASDLLRAHGSRLALHLRGRATPAARLYALVEELGDAARASGAWLIVNDRIDVALAAGARGVQLGRRSLGVSEVRGLGPELRIGASVHDSETAALLAAARPDWLFAGNVFSTPSHADRAGRGPTLVRAVAATGIPVIAIGGIRPEHVSDLRNAGAWGVAAIRGIWHARDPVSAVQLYL